MITVTTNNGTPAIAETVQEAKAKAERNAFLADSDIYMIEDFPTTKKAEWKVYRQALRDMDFSDPDNITWPVKPT
tara:strand:+ start:227 stop:451 length:225 start_codon:yes stop_codon:yes gene_type:complete